jgi:prevent-host-death family protein
METVGALEAKTHLAALLDRVAKGEPITITKHGIPVAMLMPAAPRPAPDREDAIQKLMEFGRRRSLRGLTIHGLIEQGRRS